MNSTTTVTGDEEPLPLQSTDAAGLSRVAERMTPFTSVSHDSKPERATVPRLTSEDTSVEPEYSISSGIEGRPARASSASTTLIL